MKRKPLFIYVQGHVQGFIGINDSNWFAEQTRCCCAILVVRALTKKSESEKRIIPDNTSTLVLVVFRPSLLLHFDSIHLIKDHFGTHHNSQTK